MKAEEKIRERYGTNPGFKVPEGYFDNIYTKIASELPEKKPVETKPLTTWQRVRPYVYLAAMFAGIWCMMKMFHLMTTTPNVSLENPPALVAEAMEKPENVDIYVPTGVVSEVDVVAYLAEEYDTFDEFVNDFGYEFNSEVAEINFSELDLQSYDEDEETDITYIEI